MKTKQGTKFAIRGCPLAIAAALIMSSPAQAVEFDWGDWSGSWDNTISYGISWRGQDINPKLIGKGNGGTAQAILTDDGDLNFEKGDIFSNIIKGTSEIEIDNGQYGGFGRIKYWYDFELMNNGVPHGHGPNKYVAGAELNDAEFNEYARFSGLMLLDLFAYGSFELGDNQLEVRFGRQVVNWGEATFIQGINVLNPIDVNAFRRPGAEIKEGLLPVSMLYANLGMGNGWSVEAFYQVRWEQTVIDGCGTYYSDVDFAAEGCNDLIAPEVQIAPGVWLPDVTLQNINVAKKDPYVDKPANSGQFGIAVRKYVEQIDTEFGLYYQNLANRTPVINSVYSPVGFAEGSRLGGNPVPTLYQMAYPEDTKIWGLSFATNLGDFALSGEVSLKQDMPVGVNGTTQLTGVLGVVSTQGLYCGTPYQAAYGQFGQRACDGWNSFLTTGYGIGLGYDRFDVTQAQTTAIYFWDRGLGAERVSIVGEVAWIHVSDLPPISVMPYGRNPTFGAPTNLGGPSDQGFVTTDSWGYRIRASANYPNVFSGVELTPSIAWAQDVNGTSPTPSFIDGRKAISVALGANYLTRYRAAIAYTWFFGGYANTQVDRDFFSFTVSMDF